MKRITGLLFITLLLLPSRFIFAQDNPSDNSDTVIVNNDTMQAANPSTDSTPTVMPQMPTGGPTTPPPIPAMPPRIIMPKTVVATSDGGIVVVEGNKITKYDSNLQETKSIDLEDSDNKQ